MSMELILTIAATIAIGVTGYLYREHRTKKEPPHPDVLTWKTCTLLAFCDTERPHGDRRLRLDMLNQISVQNINDIAASNNFRWTQTKRVFKKKVITSLKQDELIREAAGHISKIPSKQYYELSAVGVNSIRSVFDEVHEYLFERDDSELIGYREKFVVGTVLDDKSREEVVDAFLPLISGQALQALTNLPIDTPTARRSSSKIVSGQSASTGQEDVASEADSNRSSAQKRSTREGTAGEFTIRFASSKYATGCLMDSTELRGGFLVREHSMAAKDEAPSIPSGYRALRRQLMDEGVLVRQDDHYEFVRDHHFSSPSAASSAVLGRNSNGRQDWRNSDDKSQSLGDVLKALTHQAPQRLPAGDMSSSVAGTPPASLSATSNFLSLSGYEQKMCIRLEVFKVVLNAGSLQRSDLTERVEKVLRKMGWKKMNTPRRRKIKDAIDLNLKWRYLSEDEGRIELGPKSSEARSLELDKFRDKKPGRSRNA